jgi:hypothetical protein
MYAVSIAPGATGSVMVAATPSAGFTGPVTFTCTSPVAYITCALTPSSQTISGTTTVQSTLTLTVASTVSGLNRLLRPASASITYGFLIPLGAFALLGLVRREASIWRLRLFALCVGITVLAGVTGCSGGSTSTKTAAPGVSQVVVTATSGALTQSVQLTVNVAN